jgi:hypothetical protein
MVASPRLAQYLPKMQGMPMAALIVDPATNRDPIKGLSIICRKGSVAAGA